MGVPLKWDGGGDGHAEEGLMGRRGRGEAVGRAGGGAEVVQEFRLGSTAT